MPAAASSTKPNSQGLRRPPASATAPKIGASTPMISAEMVIAQPHWAVPSTGLAATACVK